MEIKILINQENKSRILSLIDQLVQAESPSGSSKEEVLSQGEALYPAQPSRPGIHDRLDTCYRGLNVRVSPAAVSDRPLGAWAMFNSFIPGKATLRVLAHLLHETNLGAVPFEDLVEESVRSFRSRGLMSLRGFPGSRKASSIPRFATHLVLPMAEMGLISAESSNGNRRVGITAEGMEFSLVESDILDGPLRKEKLSVGEKNWLSAHLKRINDAGFREHDVLSSIIEFVGTEHPERRKLVDWFSNRRDFQDYTRSTSKHGGDPPRMRRQLVNLANTYVSSKVAILREMGVLSDARGQYEVEMKL